MNVSLTPELEDFVSAKVESRHYHSATEVFTEALHLLEEHDQARVTQLIAFKQELGRRLESLDQDIHVSPSEVRTRLDRKSEQRRRA